MAGQLTGNVGCILPALDLNEAEVGDPAVRDDLASPQSLCTYPACSALLLALCGPFSLVTLSPTLYAREWTHVPASQTICLLLCPIVPLHPAPSHPEPSVHRCLRGAAATGTFWATWLTQGEVQLLRSGPRGFQSPKAGRHWKEAIPAGTDRQDREGSHKEGEKGPKQGERR